MARFVYAIDLPLPPAAAFELLADFTRLPAWDPNARAAERVDTGPLRTGSRFRVRYGAHDPEKDKAKATQLEEFAAALQRIWESLGPATSGEKRAAVEIFRWMVEEYKVSLFAQELKTRFPVSKKKLEDARKEIERLV